jgi:hypothetical protein
MGSEGTTPGSLHQSPKPLVELEGPRIFFPEERAEAFNRLLRDHLLGA